MVGGTVKETVILSDRIWVNCESSGDECAVYVQKDPRALSISPGDAAWWQSGRVYWTPKKNGKAYAKSDIPLIKIGYSGCRRPTVKNFAKLAIEVMDDESFAAERGAVSLPKEDYDQLRRLVFEIYETLS